MALPVIPNTAARHLFLDRHALGGRRTSDVPLADLIDRIGFVQVDSINTVARAHDLILFSRDAGYRSPILTAMLERDRSLFEHWTHDAAVVPIRLFPHWRHRFARDAVVLQAQWRRFFREGYVAQLDHILTRIAQDGPVTSADVGAGEARGGGRLVGLASIEDGARMALAHRGTVDHPQGRVPQGL